MIRRLPEVLGAVVMGVVLVVASCSCSASANQKALDDFNSLGVEFCVEGDTWKACLDKCRAGCDRPAASASAPPTSASAEGGVK